MDAPTAPSAWTALLELRERLGPAAVLIGPDVPQRNCNDLSTPPPSPTLAVVRPVDAAGVSATLKACAAAGLPAVPQGGLTGLVGGARPEPGWVAMSRSRLCPPDRGKTARS